MTHQYDELGGTNFFSH